MMDQFSGSRRSCFLSQTKQVHDLQLPAIVRAASSKLISPIVTMRYLRRRRGCWIVCLDGDNGTPLESSGDQGVKKLVLLCLLQMKRRQPNTGCRPIDTS